MALTISLKYSPARRKLIDQVKAIELSDFGNINRAHKPAKLPVVFPKVKSMREKRNKGKKVWQFPFASVWVLCLESGTVRKKKKDF